MHQDVIYIGEGKEYLWMRYIYWQFQLTTIVINPHNRSLSIYMPISGTRSIIVYCWRSSLRCVRRMLHCFVLPSGSFEAKGGCEGNKMSFREKISLPYVRKYSAKFLICYKRCEIFQINYSIVTLVKKSIQIIHLYIFGHKFMILSHLNEVCM